MATTTLAEVQYQIEKFWSPVFMDQLKEKALLPTLVNKDYSGQIRKGGDQVRVSQINRPVGEMRTIGVDANVFNPEKLSTSYVDVQATKRIVASFEFEDLVDLQSQIGDQDSKIRQVLLEACELQLNKYCYSMVSPSLAAPDHSISGVTDFNATALLNVRKLASQAYWGDGEKWLLVDPSYMNDLLNAMTMTSNDYVPDSPVVAGQIALKRFGFNILEDNSSAMTQYLGATSGTDCALAFHPDWLLLVMQDMPQFKVSDLHGNKQFGYVISVDFWAGASLSISGAVKHIRVYNA